MITNCMFLLVLKLLPDCAILEEGGSTESDVVEMMEESRADEVREAFYLVWSDNEQ